MTVQRQRGTDAPSDPVRDLAAVPGRAQPRLVRASGLGRRSRILLPRPLRRTVRLRLTALYGLLFFVSGALLLAISGGVTVVGSSSVAIPARSLAPSSPLSQAQARIQRLQDQLQATSQVQHSSISHVLLLAGLIALAIMTVFSLALGWIISGRALRPVREMTAAAQRISEYNLNQRLALNGPDDELKELGDTIDGLLERLEGAFVAQRRFVANASHELRTPLTTMRASLDVALAKPAPAPPETVALAGRLRAELDRIDRLLEAFLVLARAQHGDLPSYSFLPLDYIVGAALADQAAAIESRRLAVQDTTSPGGAWVQGSQALLSRMVENLIDNAVCHNEDGGWIRVMTESEQGRARVVVENGGQVLDQQQADELCLPFRRAGADRTGSDKGSGLGLSIVTAIAEAHAGTVELIARPGGGLRVTVELPAAPSTGPAAGAGDMA